ncbi:MAG: hypothetical protein GIW99_04385 [Candidatus Eremiobacteraeota bacterium]|nr:hypothetical protein [Candidatus Eremiobacteraeota bacterium]
MLGAARTIDSALSPAESQAILRISASLRAQARQMMQNEHAQMPGGQANVAGEAHHRAMEAGMHKSWSNDPAFVLFHIVMPGPGRGEAMH